MESAEKTHRRAPEFSAAEIEQLKQEFEKRKEILDGKFSSKATFSTKSAAWEEIANEVNKVGAHNRSVDKIKKKWSNLTSEMKSQISQKSKSLRLTGGGVGEPPLTDEEERMAGIIGHVKIFGVEGGIDTSDRATSASNNQRAITYSLSSPVGNSVDVDDSYDFGSPFPSPSCDHESECSTPTSLASKRRHDSSSSGTDKRRSRVSHLDQSTEYHHRLLHVQEKILDSLTNIHDGLTQSNRIWKETSDANYRLMQEFMDIQKQRLKIDLEILSLKKSHQ